MIFNTKNQFPQHQFAKVYKQTYISFNISIVGSRQTKRELFICGTFFNKSLRGILNASTMRM
jgi:hypothetical protein